MNKKYIKGDLLTGKRFTIKANTPNPNSLKFYQRTEFLINLIVILMLIGIAFFSIFGTVGYKPAIYLYPEQPTKVNLILEKSIKITYDAPKHHPEKGWNVLAYPNSKIKDLQPEYTDCNKLETDKFGLEYATRACQTNNYPYVFWEGYLIKNIVPKMDDGWIVGKSNLNEFLIDKLDYIGFNKAEKDEFLKYWVTILSQRKEEKFFINFLQAQEVNEYAPLTINPKPESINRIYMVVKPLKYDLDLIVQPQKLEKFKRKGFTLVEWGGTIVK